MTNLNAADIRSIDALLNSVVLEGRNVSEPGDAADHNYMPAANRVMREMERLYGPQCIAPLIERIADGSIDGPVIRVMVASLMRLVPTRQTIYERILTETLPSWRTIVEGNPQDELQPQFLAASDRAKREVIEYPRALVPALLKATYSSSPDVAITALKALVKLGDPASIDSTRRLINDSQVASVRNTAILSTARLSSMDENTNRELANLVFREGQPINERVAAFEAITVSGGAIENVESLQDMLAAEQVDIELLDCILDSGREELVPTLEHHLKQYEFSNLPEATLRRISRKKSLSGRLRQAVTLVLSDISGKRRESLDIARSQRMSRVGLIAHRNASWTAGWVGHAGIFTYEDWIAHCTPGYDPRAVHQLSFESWKDGLECWGIRRIDPPIDLWVAVNRANEISSWRTEYDGTHNNQKGQWFKGWFCAPTYWEADCVGFTEHCYEHAGGNPTPSSYETGGGWPLTVREQRDHMVKVMDC